MWTFQGESAFASTGVLASGSLYVALGGALYALNPATGVQVWKQSIPGTVFGTLAHAGGKVAGVAWAQTPNTGTLFAVSAASGSLLWQTSLDLDANVSPAAGGGLIVIGTTDGIVRAFNASNETIAWTFKTGCAVRATAALG